MDDPDTQWNVHHCLFCSYKTSFDHYILRHVRLHRTRSKNHRFNCNVHTPERYQCEKCRSRFDFKVLLAKHFDAVHKTKKTQHYPNPVIRYCEHCDFRTYSVLVLLSHKEKKHARGRPLHKNREKDGFFHCSYCSYKTKYSNGCLKAHMRRKHTPANQIKWLECEHCSYKAREKRTLQDHSLRHHSKQFNWLKCEYCPYEGQNKYKLSRHVLLRHTETVDPKKVKYHKCDQCSYKTLQKEKVKVHRLMKHTPPEQINWFKCEHCPYKAKLKGILAQHVLKIHTKPKGLKKLQVLHIKLEPIQI